MTPTRDDIERLLPLQPTTLHILLALANEERHGYAIIQEVAARTNGQLHLSAGTLYRSLHRMLQQGLAVESIRRRPADDERRRYYRLTAFGRDTARAEMNRLAGLLTLARWSGLAPEER